MKKDWADRIILKFARKYSKDETVAGLREILSKVMIELGKSEAYCVEMEEKVKELEEKIKHLEGRLNFPTDMEKQIRSLEQELKRTQKKANLLERTNQLILSRFKASEPKT